jgi:hypothetical protein
MQLGNFNVRFNRRDKTYEVEIRSLNSDDIIGFGAATCSRKIEFVKDTGRKIALKKALSDSFLNKQERYDIWESYRTMTAMPRWGKKKEQHVSQLVAKKKRRLLGFNISI